MTLTESRHFPTRLVQTSPAEPKRHGPDTRYSIIDLDLSKYDRIAARFQREAKDAVSFLKSGIETRIPRFNQLIEQIEQVAIHAKDPILLMGPTGAGKSPFGPTNLRTEEESSFLNSSTPIPVWFVMIAVFQMIGLAEFIEGLVFKPPAAVTGLVTALLLSGRLHTTVSHCVRSPVRCQREVATPLSNRARKSALAASLFRRNPKQGFRVIGRGSEMRYWDFVIWSGRGESGGKTMEGKIMTLRPVIWAFTGLVLRAG